MRIYALEILFAVGILSMPAVGAEAVRRESTPLPQFMPPAARAQVESTGTKPATKETRRAAEALSAKFSEDLAASNDDATAGTEKAKTTAPVAINPQSDSATQAHVAVLRSRVSSTASTPKKSKGAHAKAATVSDPSKSKKTKAYAGHAQEPRRMPVESYGKAQDLTSNAVPGAKAGWQTGLIGMLTNPAFWH
ncbi:hypothetical protein HYPDE_38318 [Hyphomicrobium denitrificans 1NES1]|uniref:Uncharacterized protein n=1 Tax=Hyphomicrobium denitrificans 1NES1 TaxID=670307 RepID=N0BGR2_9HYPH|nr:hypothetical protein [Hyphomicrobium denitrificans]AGK59335.1 hypothetical protein HYPDE_38318 [Hyphomicrobium denitrificans 1NES1]